MTTSLVRAARFALLLAAGFVLGTVALTLATATGGKNSLLQTLGLSHAKSGPALADASCTIPGKDSSQDVYFVSCGGFF